MHDGELRATTVTMVLHVYIHAAVSERHVSCCHCRQCRGREWSQTGWGLISPRATGVVSTYWTTLTVLSSKSFQENAGIWSCRHGSMGRKGGSNS